LLASGDDFLADAVAGDGCDAIGFHVSVLQMFVGVTELYPHPDSKTGAKLKASLTWIHK
jgi:hypothetical protein